MNKQTKNISLIIMFLFLLFCGLNSSSVVRASAKSKEIQLVFNAGANVYGKNGKKLSSYNGKKAYFPKASVIKYYGDIVWIKKKPYYYIGKGGYISATMVAIVNGKNTFCLNHNSFVYDKNGKRIKHFFGSHGKTKLDYRQPVNFVGNLKKVSNNAKYYIVIGNPTNPNNIYNTGQKYYLPYKNIKGEYYYYLGHGDYIKANNVSLINGYFHYTTIAKGKVRGVYKKTVMYDSQGELIKGEYLKKGQILTFDAVKSKKNNNFYRITGTNKWVIGFDLEKDPDEHINLMEVK